MGVTAKSLHVNKVLSEMAMGYRPDGMIADMIFPMVSVSKQSDIYLVHDRGRLLRRQSTQRSPGAEARKVDFEMGSATYYARNYALKAPVTIEDKANADPEYAQQLITNRAQLVMDDLALDREVRVSNLVNNTSNVGSSAAVTSAWNGAGHPLTDINAAIDNVKYANGKAPNLVIFGPEAWDSFRRDSNVRNLIKGSNNGGGYVNETEVRNLLNVETVLISQAFQNTGEEGQTEALSTILGDNVLIAYSAKTPSKERPSFGYEFRWAAPGLPNMMVERHPYDQKTKSEEVEVGYYSDDKITGASYGFLLTAVNSST